MNFPNINCTKDQMKRLWKRRSREWVCERFWHFFFSLSISFSPSTQLRIDYRLEASTSVNAFLVCQPSLHSLLLSMLFLHSELELLSSTRAVPLYEHFIKPKYIVAKFRKLYGRKIVPQRGLAFPVVAQRAAARHRIPLAIRSLRPGHAQFVHWEGRLTFCFPKL